MVRDTIRASGRAGRYLWAVSQFALEGATLTTSNEIAAAVNVNASQVRRDLSILLGKTGKRGVGYNTRNLLTALRSGTTVDVYGTGPIANALRDGTALALLGIEMPRVAAETPDVAVIDYPDAGDGRRVAGALAHAGVSVIVNYGPYLIEASPARVVHASPLLTLAEAVA